jgi:hypothetical protein
MADFVNKGTRRTVSVPKELINEILSLPIPLRTVFKLLEHKRIIPAIITM